MDSERSTVIIFGSSGAIGRALVQTYLEENWNVISVSRQELEFTEVPVGSFHHVSWGLSESPDLLLDLIPNNISAIVWAQGSNCADEIGNFDETAFRVVFDGNVTYVLNTLHKLLTATKLLSPCRLIVISSIWQEISRNQKLAYTVSKSALRGLVQSVAADIGPEGHLINAILPGVLDTPMTRTALSFDQIATVMAQTPTKKLATVQDVCNLTYFLTSNANNGITGQFIRVDGGFSDIRLFQ